LVEISDLAALEAAGDTDKKAGDAPKGMGTESKNTSRVYTPDTVGVKVALPEMKAELKVEGPARL
jgi:hypothetical protein